MKLILSCCVLLLASTQAFAAKSCDELKSEINAKIEAKHVSGFSLEVVDSDKVGAGKVVGSCEGGSKKIVYNKK